MRLTEKPFGMTKNGEAVSLFCLENEHGTVVNITNYGATITSIFTPDKEGGLADIVLGFDSIGGYEGSDNPYFGATCGRYANRICKGQFKLNGKTYQLATNNEPNALHGGIRGFDKFVWYARKDGERLIMKRVSPDGEEGYPGTLEVEVYFQLTSDNELQIEYRASTDQTTIINLTNHSYFNLAGDGAVLDHLIRINADRYVVVDEYAIPTGELRPVAGTEMDLHEFTPVGLQMDEVQGGGYDHNYCLNQHANELTLAAEVIEPTSGRTLTCLTTQPGVQFYSGNFLTGVRGKVGKLYEKHAGFCLETQYYPDSPNQTHFPSTRLQPGEDYRHKCVYRFGLKVD